MIRAASLLLALLLCSSAHAGSFYDGGFYAPPAGGGGGTLTWEDLSDQGAVIATRDIYSHGNGAITYSGTTVLVPLNSNQVRASVADSYTSEWAVPASMKDSGGKVRPGILYWKITDTDGALTGTDYQVGFGWADAGTPSNGVAAGVRFQAAGTAQAAAASWTAALSGGAIVTAPTEWRGAVILEGEVTAGVVCTASASSAIIDGSGSATSVEQTSAGGKHLALVIGHWTGTTHTITAKLRVQFAFQPFPEPS